MRFNYFRIFITFLASFGAFFAYICRLNLSLTIGVMVVQDEQDLKVNQSTGTQTQDSSKLNMLSSIINNEEHTLAWMSQSSRRLQWQTDSNKLKPSTRNGRRKSPIVWNQTGGRISPLSIDFDVSKNVNDSKGEQQPNNKTAPTDPKGGQDHVDVQDVLGSPPNLMEWSEENRNDLLGAFFLGYVVSQIPAARGAEIFGAKSLILMTGFGATFCSLIFPFASKFSPNNIIYAYIVRIVLGATQGALFPAIYVLLCQWLPKSERSKWLPYPSAFSRIGAIVMNFVVPLVLVHYDWETVFYLSAGTTALWCILFIIFGSDSPSTSYWISKDELVYIESHMEPRVGTLNQQPPSLTASGYTINESGTLNKPRVSWFKMATNKPILVLTIVMFTSEWSNMLLLVKLPGFIGPVLQMDLVEIGFWSSVLVSIYCIQYPLSGLCATKLENTEVEFLSSLRVRKIFEAAAHLMQAAGCFMIAFSSSKVVILSALMLMMLGRSTVGGGQCLMPPELSKDYPGTVFAFANTLANLAGVIGPKTVTWMVGEDTKNHESWSSLFILSGCLFIVGGLVFCVFGDNKPQNYCKKPIGGGKQSSISQAQLTVDKNPAEEIFKMDAFSRVGSEPSSRRNNTSADGRMHQS